MNKHACPLCQSEDNHLFHQDKRTYLRCQRCLLVFVDESQRLSTAQEKEIYDLHENNPDDEGYKKFLMRLSKPLIEKLNPKSQGLDFGCGPGPTLSKLFEQEGHQVALYDKFYFDKPELLQEQYDFVSATEVVEHLYQPGLEIKRLIGMLKDSGVLGIMTKLVRDKEAFSKWHYKNDQTHVCFFSKETFLWLAQEYTLDLEFIGDDVIILLKRP